MDLRTAKRIFLTAKEAQGVISRTLESYTTELSRFFEFAISKDIYSITEVTAELIREFLNSLKEKKLRNITIRRYYKELNTLFLFLQREDHITVNPMKHIQAPKAEQKQMRTFTGKEISKLLNSFDKNDFFGMRNYCIMATFFSTGIRKMGYRGVFDQPNDDYLFFKYHCITCAYYDYTILLKDNHGGTGEFSVCLSTFTYMDNKFLINIQIGILVMYGELCIISIYDTKWGNII